LKKVEIWDLEGWNEIWYNLGMNRKLLGLSFISLLLLVGCGGNSSPESQKSAFAEKIDVYAGFQNDESRAVLDLEIFDFCTNQQFQLKDVKPCSVGMVAGGKQQEIDFYRTGFFIFERSVRVLIDDESKCRENEVYFPFVSDLNRSIIYQNEAGRTNAERDFTVRGLCLETIVKKQTISMREVELVF